MGAELRSGMITVVDYGMGNLHSVENALDYLGLPHTRGATPDEIQRSPRLLLPGVGSFREAMEHLDRYGLSAALRAAVREGGAKLLGICLGMQLLADWGEEDGGAQGLGLIPGRVTHLRPPDPSVKIPHVGFNTVRILEQTPLFEGIADDSCFYFVHSYRFETERRFTIASSSHGREFASVVAAGKVVGAQFHPERSQGNGLRLLKNFWEGPTPC